jgi:tetratricopeptide (TPR) repeat protein
MAYKQQLIDLSEEIVSLSDQLDELEFTDDPATTQPIINRLRAIGDELLQILEDAFGDDEAYAQFALGSVCSLLGLYEKAEICYDTALSHWPDHIGILNEAFDILIELGKFDKAKAFIERSIKHGGETPDILYNYASLVSHMGDIDEARIILINALAKFPADKGCRALLQELDLLVNEQNQK